MKRENLKKANTIDSHIIVIEKQLSLIESELPRIQKLGDGTFNIMSRFEDSSRIITLDGLFDKSNIIELVVNRREQLLFQKSDLEKKLEEL